jgi:hypothetical protein
VRYYERNPHIVGRGQYPPGGRVRLNQFWMRQLPRVQRANAVAHEIGHALGLHHLPGCAVMFGGGGLGANCRAPAGREACGPQRHDTKALIRLYGGSLGNFRGFNCPDNPHYS